MAPAPSQRSQSQPAERVAWIHPDEVLGRAGPAFARGEAYFRQGRVSALKIDGNQVSANVLGNREAAYPVSLRRKGESLVGACACPIGETTFCKHQVAVAFAAGFGEGLPAEDTRWLSTPDLRIWLEKRELLSAFYRSAVEILPALGEQGAGLRHTLSTEPLTGLVLREAAHSGLSSRLGPLFRPAREAAWERLQALATDAAQGRDEEPERIRCPLSPEPSWWKPLLELRLKVRPGCAPMSAAVLATGAFTTDPARCGWRWKPADPVQRHRFVHEQHAIVTVEFVGLTPEVHCTCDVTISGGCAHKLAAIDAFLVRLRDPAEREGLETLVSELSRPAWARVLSALDQLEKSPPPERAPPEIIVGWSVDFIHQLHVVPMVTRRLKSGALSDPKPSSVAGLIDKYGDVLVDLDRRIARLAQSEGWGRRSTAGELLALLADHPRVTGDDGRTPLRIFKGPLELRVVREPEALRLEAGVGELTVSAAEALAAIEDPQTRQVVLLALDRHQAAVGQVSAELRATLEVLAREGARFPPESEGELLDRLTRLSSRMRVAHGEGVLGDEIQPQPRWSLVLAMDDGELRGTLRVRPLPGAPSFPPGDGPREVPGAVRSKRVFVRRDLSGEKLHARGLLAELPLRAAVPTGPFAFLFEEPSPALELISRLRTACPEGLSVEWEEVPVEVVSLHSAQALRVEVDRKQDWFGLNGFAQVSGWRIELAMLLDAARRDLKFARLDDRRWVELDTTLRAQLAAVADHAFAHRSGLELSPGAVSSMEQLEAAGAALSADVSWKRLAQRLEEATAAKPKVPASLKTTLRDYQLEGFRWASRLSRWADGAVLADDMGLGKTIQALALLLERSKLGPALVVAPTSVCFNWVDECRKFAPRLRTVVLGEGDRAKALAELGPGDLLIVSYGLLPREAEALAKLRFATLILDEAQAVKNASTQRARAARELQAEFKLALSGTPLENNLAELWSLFRVVFPALLGSWEQFRERFASPIERARDPHAMQSLSRVLRPFLLRRTKAEVARELPARTEIEVPVVLSDAERALYDDARLAALGELERGAGRMPESQRRIQVLAALTRLRLLSSHPRLYEPTSPVGSSKMARLLELVEQLRAEGHRALIFSQFTSHLALVRESLEEAEVGYQLLQGDTPLKERARRVKAFQGGEGDVFLISLKAGGTGLNLTGADYVIHLDPWWNPAVEDQATDRAHRIGQDKPVTVYRLVSRGTIEEKILALHADKRTLVSEILEGTGAAAKLSTRELLSLLEEPRP